jgi:hypothetical protein
MWEMLIFQLLGFGFFPKCHRHAEYPAVRERPDLEPVT